LDEHIRFKLDRLFLGNSGDPENFDGGGIRQVTDLEARSARMFRARIGPPIRDSIGGVHVEVDLILDSDTYDIGPSAYCRVFIGDTVYEGASIGTDDGRFPKPYRQVMLDRAQLVAASGGPPLLVDKFRSENELLVLPRVLGVILERANVIDMWFDPIALLPEQPPKDPETQEWVSNLASRVKFRNLYRESGNDYWALDDAEVERAASVPWWADWYADWLSQPGNA